MITLKKVHVVQTKTIMMNITDFFHENVNNDEDSILPFFPLH